jgi:hypothetical protein
MYGRNAKTPCAFAFVRQLADCLQSSQKVID